MTEFQNLIQDRVPATKYWQQKMLGIMPESLEQWPSG